MNVGVFIRKTQHKDLRKNEMQNMAKCILLKIFYLKILGKQNILYTNRKMVRGEECQRGMGKLKFKGITHFGAKRELWHKEKDKESTQVQ